jgi:hypothetical protein
MVDPVSLKCIEMEDILHDRRNSQGEKFPNCGKFHAEHENDLDGKALPKMPALTLAA